MLGMIFETNPRHAYFQDEIFPLVPGGCFMRLTYPGQVPTSQRRKNQQCHDHYRFKHGRKPSLLLSFSFHGVVFLDPGATPKWQFQRRIEFTIHVYYRPAELGIVTSSPSDHGNGWNAMMS